ncbi:MAG TPA: rRNA maturation RNase YbeY [Candidatus Magasanikbacteria bacterium]|uniref:Endoribonuclease YbeY n=2 Tax=Candidatus Magasanikiibacteriota TaxID=1752731 RepID=A0A0G1C721_9BACT|nr:MAG: putative rRNA maturation factor [Candidatus Magasanikbacteria bacterium GW2011_GWC2_41_17]KKS54486.1 MAG: putative rRNA maturation factor [Candidatus Magasanikbacteria bacterium GW2011_GWA2_42_32]HBV58309.1 rRNA maturation RNase YbeY [Candidatus Magasanikbacteria bacterium]HBX16389.1 rRNA maturation RNase YbeY [Candidatus Magasanikbacteria bacterium]
MIEINNQTTSASLDFFLKKVADYCLKKLAIKKDISIVLVTDKKIQELNKIYRKKNKVTDVLSFGDWNDKDFLGEVIICLPQAKRQAKKYSTLLKQELTRLLTHGILHLAGFDHEKSKSEEKKMFKLQEEIIEKICSIFAR